MSEVTTTYETQEIVEEVVESAPEDFIDFLEDHLLSSSIFVEGYSLASSVSVQEALFTSAIIKLRNGIFHCIKWIEQHSEEEPIKEETDEL